jgi:hydroxyacylglutathione hydrolase
VLNVKQYRYGADNLAYLVYSQKDALVIDGGAYKEILDFIEYKKLNLLFIANTHSHYDHTSGNGHFLRQLNVQALSYRDLIKEEKIELEGQKIKIYDTPGHTNDSVCFHVGKILISGDTLFNGTIGNCFSGNLEGFYQSIRKLMLLTSDTIIYAGHDYVKDAMSYAKMIEPDNHDIDAFLTKFDADHVFSTLEDEFRVNPYLRFNEGNIIAILKKRGLPRETEWQRWQSLMSIE